MTGRALLQIFSRTKRAAFLALGIGLLAATAWAAAPTLKEAAQLFGLPADAVERMMAGEVVAAGVEASSEKDLSLTVGARMDAPLDRVYSFVKTDELAATQTVTVASGRIDPVDPAASLAALELDAATVASLAEDPGGTFFLSAAEAKAIRSAGASGALAAYRSVLAERARVYWQKGLAGIEPYAGDGRSPADDLRAAAGATALFGQVPDVEAEMSKPPSQSGGKMEHQLFWALQQARDQAAPVLFHRALFKGAGGEVFIERRFYSGYDYDSLQLAVGVLPLSDGASAVFYQNRTFTAQVAGFGGSAKRSIGRNLLESQLVAELQRVQKALADAS